MFQYYWPEETMCDKCGNTREGSTFYVCEEPLYSVCVVCDPLAHKDAQKFAFTVTEEVMLNGWEWLKSTHTQHS